VNAVVRHNPSAEDQRLLDCRKAGALHRDYRGTRELPAPDEILRCSFAVEQEVVESALQAHGYESQDNESCNNPHDALN
jgi:hypothetical protein